MPRTPRASRRTCRTGRATGGRSGRSSSPAGQAVTPAVTLGPPARPSVRPSPWARRPGRELCRLAASGLCLLVLLRSPLTAVTGDTRPPLRCARRIRRGCPIHVVHTTWMWHPRLTPWCGRSRSDWCPFSRMRRGHCGNALNREYRFLARATAHRARTAKRHYVLTTVASPTACYGRRRSGRRRSHAAAAATNATNATNTTYTTSKRCASAGRKGREGKRVTLLVSCPSREPGRCRWR